MNGGWRRGLGGEGYGGYEDDVGGNVGDELAL